MIPPELDAALVLCEKVATSFPFPSEVLSVGDREAGVIISPWIEGTELHWEIVNNLNGKFEDCLALSKNLDADG